MRKTIGFALILCASTLSLSGCLLTRVAGPCYGVGCPSFTSSSQPKVAQTPIPADATPQGQQAASAQPMPTSSSQPNAAPSQPVRADASQAKRGKFTRMLTALHLHSKS